jgi:ABC-type branched-subunit amino acid transport system substrate-binding protein
LNALDRALDPRRWFSPSSRTGVIAGAAALLALLSLGFATAAAGGEPAAGPQKKGAGRAVFHDGRERPLEYVGPGRELPEPADAAEVRIGYFGPDDPSHAEAGDLWSAAQLAIEEANRQGGYRGKPFRLVARWSDNPWTSGARSATRMVFVDKVWAIIGGIDGASTHLAEQIAAKALIPVISPVSTDRSANSAFVPWMFSCLPGDDVLAPLIAERLVREKLQDAFVVVAADDHDSRVFLGQLTGSFQRQRIAPRHQFVAPTASGDATTLVDRVIQSKPRAIVLLAGPATGARLLKALRTSGYGGPVLGGPWMGRRPFLEAAANGSGDLVFPLLYVPEENPNDFLTAFSRRHHSPPDYAAAATYDAVMLVVAAVRKAGLNRARIADALRDLSPWKGASGTLRWDALGGNSRPATLGTLRDGRAVSLPK